MRKPDVVHVCLHRVPVTAQALRHALIISAPRVGQPAQRPAQAAVPFYDNRATLQQKNMYIYILLH